MYSDKSVPSDVDAEEAIIGACLIDPEGAIPDVVGAVGASEFYREKNGWTFDAIVTLWLGGERVNQITVAKELERVGRLESIGGVAYLSQCVAQTPTSVGADSYARIVRTCSFNRRLISIGGQICAVGYENLPPTTAMGRSQEKLLTLTGLMGGAGLRSLHEIATERREEIEAWLTKPETAVGTPSGFPDLDSTIGGFEPGRFYVVAARPAMGKSQLSLWFAINVARAGKPVAIFSLEMTEFSLLLRIVLGRAGLNRYSLRVAGVSEAWLEEWREKFRQTLGDVSSLPIWIDDTADVTTATVRARVAQLKASRNDVGLVVFDYGDLAGDSDGENEQQRVSNITRRLKAMAMGLHVPVVGVYQLNREVEKLGNKRPTLAHLRMSGRIEADADVVLMLYRPAYYREMENEPVPPEEEHLLEVLIRKQRDGATGTVPLYFDRKTGRIASMERAV